MGKDMKTEDRQKACKESFFRKVAGIFAREREVSYGDAPVFDQLEQRVLLSANPLSDTWSPDQEQYADNAVVAMPLTAGETGVAVTNAVIDVKAPTIGALSVTNNKLLNGPVELTAVVRDTDSATLDWQLTITNKDTGQTFVLTGDPLSVPGSGQYTFSLGQIDPAVIGDGNFLLSFQVTDPGGNSAVKEVNFTVDATAPVVESITANREVLQTFESVLFTVNASDNVAVTRYAFSMNGKQMTTGKAFQHTFTEAGTYVLTAVAYDKAGNASETFTQVITVAECPDVKAPIIGITSPTNNSCVKDGAVITVTVRDSDSLEVNWTATLINNDTGQRYSLGSGDRAISSQTLLTLRKGDFPDGSYTVEVEAVDKGGNRTLVTRDFVFDTIPPEVSIETGSQRFETGTMRLRLDIEEENPGNYTLFKINGRNITPDANQRYIYQFAEAGEYTLVATVRDKAGNETTVTRVITIAENTDFTPPSVTIESPASGAWYNSDVEVQATITDNAAAYMAWTVRVTYPDGSTAVVQRGEGTVNEGIVYTLPIKSYYPNGAYAVEIEAVDAAGNITVERVSFMVDTVAPMISDNFRDYYVGDHVQRYLKDPFTLRWTMSDNVTPENMVAWTVLCTNKDTGRTTELKTGVGFNADMTIDPAQFASGRYEFKLQVVDAAGNTRIGQVFETHMDAVPPILHSVSYEMSWPGFRLFLTASDNNDLRYCRFYYLSSPAGHSPDLAHVAYPGADDNVCINGYGSGDSPAKEGTYVLRIEAVDRCGNVSESQYLTIVVKYT